ncbi:substrate-binding domain-containing protein [Desulfurivibrio sp. D14AmB]|uniref:substrate-binding domain-containing protein n=1 Tax=Desulfurivibrio sp. D14AmB TaxID=3374370 RepID=UPI00376EA0C8
MKNLLSTKEVAQLLSVNEKMVYLLIAEKGLPATKVTGKWLFPRHLVERWIENSTQNFPAATAPLPPYHGLLIMAGSDDPLLEQTLNLFNRSHPGQLAVYGNVGSFGGLRALRDNLCHLASSHLLQEEDGDFNFQFAAEELPSPPAVINFCFREQGLLLAKGNPLAIGSVADLARKKARVVNRPLSTGTRLLFEQRLHQAGVPGKKLTGYDREVARHLDVGLEILAGRADAGPAIRAVAALLGLDFLPLGRERFDLLIARERFFDKGVQLFLGLLHEPPFRQLAQGLAGYDVSQSGRTIFPQEATDNP